MKIPNEEIITGLKNAIARKETLEQAMQIMINSGYSARQVQEASKFVGRGILNIGEPRPDEQLIMPEEKGFFSKLKFWKKKPSPLQKKPLTTKQSDKILQKTQHIQQLVKKQQGSPQEAIQTSPEKIESRKSIEYLQTKFGKESLAKQLKQIQPAKKSHLTEIILVIVLLLLLIILAVIIFFKGTIFGWFS